MQEYSFPSNASRASARSYGPMSLTFGVEVILDDRKSKSSRFSIVRSYGNCNSNAKRGYCASTYTFIYPRDNPSYQ